MMRLRSVRAVPVVLVVLAVLGFFNGACSPSPAVEKAAPQAPARTPARVMGYEGAGWLEREERVEEEKPEVVLRAMKLRDGDVVADVGAGTGFFARRIARAVAPSGKVYANEIQPKMLERLQELAREEGLTNIVPVLGTETDPKLPAGRMDWVLLVDVYHELQQPEPMLAKIRQSLKPGGKVALVEYRKEDPAASHILVEHLMSVDQILAEWEPAGFQLVERVPGLPSQHLLIFTVRTDG